MRNSFVLWLVAALLIFLDWYMFQALKAIVQNVQPKLKGIIFFAYKFFALVSFLGIVLFPYLYTVKTYPLLRNYVFSLLFGIFLAKLLGSLFFLVDDIRRLFTWAYHKTLLSKTSNSVEPKISRSIFLSWFGLAISGTIFSTLFYGFKNKYNYQIKRITLQYSTLPNSFEGFKLVHISDIHSGSFTNRKAVERGVEMIVKEQPDLIAFTGDLVNDRATEMNDYAAVFSKLNAPYGVYSTLGNHDYGDYVRWDSVQSKQENQEALKKVHANMGWRLLQNEHHVIEKAGDKIAILGVENWGDKGRFPKYGKMDLAHKDTEKYPFKILLSHDPSHWDGEILKKYTDIDLMLSGHTHGMQFGIENPYLKWSPVQWMYKQWAGLYENGSNKLYVNRGFGFIGYPGRVGIMPEITVISFTKKLS